MAGLRTINHVDMHNRNIVIVVNQLYQNGPLSRAQIAKNTGLNKATVTGIIRQLIDLSLVIETGVNSPPNGVGHPSIDIKINPQAGHVIGAEIRCDQVSVAVLDFSPGILWRETRTLTEPCDLDGVMGTLLRMLKKAYHEFSHHPVSPSAVVIGLPGLMDLVTNTLLDSPDLGWKNVPIGRLIQKEIPLPVAIGNSAHMASIAETYFGSSREPEVSLYLNIGLLINSGIVIMDSVLSGSGGMASEAGHISVDPGGERCSCGSTGCWNQVASLRALLDRVGSQIKGGASSILPAMVQGNLDRLTLDHILRAARENDKVALTALEKTAYWLGVGIANLINLLDPESVVLGGPMSAAYDILLPVIQREVDQRSYVASNRKCALYPAKLGEDSCLYGALAVVFWNFMNKFQYITFPEEKQS